MRKISLEELQKVLESRLPVKCIEPKTAKTDYMFYGPPNLDMHVAEEESPYGNLQFQIQNRKPKSSTAGSSISIEELEDIIEKRKKESVTFQDYVFKKMQEKGLTDPDVYHKINMDAKLFNKIKNQKSDKSISFDAAFSIGYALELDLDEMKDLIKKAGKYFKEDLPRHVIMQYYVECKVYDYDELNESLINLKLKPLNLPKEEN